MILALPGLLLILVTAIPVIMQRDSVGLRW